jgi:hypothetical protein
MHHRAVQGIPLDDTAMSIYRGRGASLAWHEQASQVEVLLREEQPVVLAEGCLVLVQLLEQRPGQLPELRTPCWGEPAPGRFHSVIS